MSDYSGVVAERRYSSTEIEVIGDIGFPSEVKDVVCESPFRGPDCPLIGHENAHARMSAFLAIISAIFTKLLQLKWSETDNCIRCWDSDSVSAVADDEEPWCCVP